MKLSGKVVAVALLFAGLVLLNILVRFVPLRWDLTQDRVYSLSEGTVRVLEKIEEPIALEFYFSRSNADVPIEFKNYATRVEEMLRQYVAKSRGKISLKVIDPKPDTDEEIAARRLGLEPQPVASGETVYFGLSVTLADQEKAIPLFAPSREPYLEYDISQLIYSVQEFTKPKLGVISGVPLGGTPPEMAMQLQMQGQRAQPAQFSYQEWQQRFDVVEIEPTAEKLPDGLSLLAVIHPTDLSEKLLFAIDQYVLSGKPAFIAVDPSSYILKAQNRQQQMMMGMQQGNSSDLPRLFAAWGITYDAQTVLGDASLATKVNTGQTLMEYPVWMDLGAAQFSRDALPTSGLQKMLFVEAGSISVASDRGYEVTPLVTTSDKAGGVPAMTMQFTPPAEIAKQIKPEGAVKNLAVLVRGKFKTAFPGGAPKDPPKPEEPKTEGEAAATDKPADEAKPAEPVVDTTPVITESAQPSALVVVADTDWLMDNFSVRSLGIMGLVQPLNDNYVFSGNVMDFLGGSQDLVSVRGKATVLRPFEVIREMERAAQQRLNAQVDELQTRLSDVEKKINEKMQADGGVKRLVLTPEVEAEIAAYRADEADIRSRLRETRRALREDVDALKNLLTVINLLGVPALVGAFGITFFLNRNRREKAA
ncbi:MAG: Gldg family protein [Opitutaceae bacterium]|nr:Gldg family protein [Opitutaceae bacterium]